MRKLIPVPAILAALISAAPAQASLSGAKRAVRQEARDEAQSEGDCWSSGDCDFYITCSTRRANRSYLCKLEVFSGLNYVKGIARVTQLGRSYYVFIRLTANCCDL
ncbi:MAG: hypothetical protein ACJ780_19735 [Solirubrobacteraceae bacterium]